jgi:hypothetical protein
MATSGMYRSNAWTSLPTRLTFFHTNAVPLYFISPTPFNLRGLDRPRNTEGTVGRFS